MFWFDSITILFLVFVFSVDSKARGLYVVFAVLKSSNIGEGLFVFEDWFEDSWGASLEDPVIFFYAIFNLWYFLIFLFFEGSVWFWCDDGQWAIFLIILFDFFF